MNDAIFSLIFHVEDTLLDALHLVLLMDVAPVVDALLLSIAPVHERRAPPPLLGDDRFGIVVAEAAAVLFLIELAHLPRLVDKVGGQIFEFREPVANVIAALIVVLALLDDIEPVQPSTRHASRCAPVLEGDMKKKGNVDGCQ
jgi:hypothetical protein